MSEQHSSEPRVVFSVSGEMHCEDNLAEFHPHICLSGSFPKAFGEGFINAFYLRFNDFIFMINDEISSYSESSAPADDK